MLHSCFFQGIPMDHHLPSYRSSGRRHNFNSCSSLDDRFGVRNCSSAFRLSERSHFGGGRCSSYRSQSLQNLSGNRGNPMLSAYQGCGERAVLGSCGSFGGGNYGGGNQHGRTHLSGCRGSFNGDSNHRSDLGGGDGLSGGITHGNKKTGSAVGRSQSRWLGGVGGLGDCSGGKSGGHSGESNGDRGGYGDGRHPGEGSLGGHLGRRGSICDIGRGRTQRVHIKEGLQNPVHVDTDPEIQTVQMEEREQIKNLKRQCASCIKKVHLLEQQNTVLSTQWEMLQHQGFERKSLRNTESLFQSYMQDMRMLLNTVRGQKGQLLSELRQLQAVTEEYEKKHKKALHKRLATENKFAALKKNIDTAYKDNMDMDVKADLLIEQIVRLRGIYEMELIEFQRRTHEDTHDIALMNNHKDLNIDNLLEEVRCQYEDIVQRSKEEVEARCQSKHEELHAIHGMHYEHLHISHQEIQELTHRIQTLKMEIGNLKKKNTRLRETIADSEQRGDRALQDAKEKLHDLEHALQKARDQLTQLQQDFQEQLNVNLALDIENTICRKQLERRDCKPNQVNSVHSSASGRYGGERGTHSNMKNNGNSGGLCGSGGGDSASGMPYGPGSQGYSSRRGSYILGVTTCSGSRTYSVGGEGCNYKETNSPTTRECDHKGMGTSANDVCRLAAYGDGESPGSGGNRSRDISNAEECRRDYRNGGSASETISRGFGDSEGRENSGSRGHDSRNICSFGEGVCSPSACESGGYTFGISTGRSRHGSGVNVSLESGGYGSREGAESGTHGYGYRGRPSYEGGRGESIQPPPHRNGYGYENGRCTHSHGNREFGSLGISNSGGIVSSPVASESGKYSLESRIHPGGSRNGSGVEVSFGRGGYGSRDGPTCESGRNSIPPPEYGSCYEGERSSGSRHLDSRGISGGGRSNPWSYERRGNGSGSGMCGSEGSGLTCASGGTSGSRNEEYGSRIMSNPKGGVSSPGVDGTGRYSSGI